MQASDSRLARPPPRTRTPTGIGATSFDLSRGIVGYDYTITQADCRFLLTATAVPEPATCAALAGLLAFAFAAIRRRRVQSALD